MSAFEFDYWDLVNLLGATPYTRAEAQDFLQRENAVRVPRGSFESMWDRLEERLGIDRAVDAVCELVLATAHERLKMALQQYDEAGAIHARLNEPKIIDLLFDGEGYPTDVGRMLLAYRRQQSTARVESQASDAKDAATADAVRAHVTLDSAEINDSPGQLSAAPGRGWRLELVRASRGTFLKAEAHWKERDLEDYLVAHWSDIDFGLDEPLRLVGRQVRLSSTREKVDLLAAQLDGTQVAVELKIVQANGADFTQLLSYLQDLAFAGVPEDKIRGLLIAPGFAEKVLNAAVGDRRVALLRFLTE